MAREGQKQVSTAGVTSLVSMFCAIALGIYHVRSLQPLDYIPYALVVGTASAAGVQLMLLSAVAPVLFGDDPPAFPRTITIPVIYVSLLLVSAVLGTSSGNSLVLPNEHFSIVLFWASPTVLLLLGVIQFVALTFLGTFLRRLDDRRSG